MQCALYTQNLSPPFPITLIKMGSVTCLFWLPLLAQVGVVRTVQNCHVTVFCSIPLVFRKSGVLRTVDGAACRGGGV